MIKWMEDFGVISKLAMGGFLFKNVMGDAMFSFFKKKI